MLAWLPAPILGTLTLLLLVGNTLVWGIPLYLLALAKLGTWGGWRARTTRGLMEVAMRWSSGNDAILRLTQRIHWDIRGDAGIVDPHASCLLTANHRSWGDILVLMRVLDRRVPFPRFLAKRELLRVPVIGTALWALDFPLVRRYGREALTQDPQLAQHDLEAIRRACERYRQEPVTLVSFLEGTRFRPYKHAAQQSPFRHLLKPKSGGIGFALEVMGTQLARHLDVTIVYPEGRSSFLDLLCGRIRRVVVAIHRGELPAALRAGPPAGDGEAFRESVQSWAWQLWLTKDAEIAAILAERPPAAVSARAREGAAAAPDDR